jgi:NADPH2 dehydrogenase
MPDLPYRIKARVKLNDYNRATFYTPKSSIGYVDYGFSEEFLTVKGARQQTV